MNVTVSLVGGDKLARIATERLVGPLVADLERELAIVAPGATRAERNAALTEALQRLRISSPRTPPA